MTFLGFMSNPLIIARGTKKATVQAILNVALPIFRNHSGGAGWPAAGASWRRPTAALNAFVSYFALAGPVFRKLARRLSPPCLILC